MQHTAKVFHFQLLMYGILALAEFTQSLSAREAVKVFGILQLPSRSTLQSFTGAFLHEPGANSDCISDQVARFDHRKYMSLWI